MTEAALGSRSFARSTSCTPDFVVFVGTSVLISGLASSIGVSEAVLDLCEAEVIQMVISRQVIVEADRNFLAKLPRLVSRFRQFIHDLKPLMIDDPGPSLVKKADAIVGRKDASILAAALEGKVDTFSDVADLRHHTK